MTGRIETIVGSMSSGKTTELGRRLTRHQIAKKRVVVFKPAIDDRYGSEVVKDRNGAFQFPAVNIPQEITEEDVKGLLSFSEDYDVVGIDEVQFFNENIIRLARSLRDSGKTVLLCGLDMDYRGEPFGFIGSLMAISCDAVKFQAVCTICGVDAVFTQKLINGNPAGEGTVVQIGDVKGITKESDSLSYEARCQKCYVPPYRIERG